MTTKTEIYARGMQAVNNFDNMLREAIFQTLPSAQIVQNGSIAWRGYQFLHYEDLAPGLFYCQFYINYPDQTPTNHELVFQEAYEGEPIGPLQNYDRNHSVQSGTYAYPFQVSLDLIRARFFLFSEDDQLILLKNFVAYAAEQALIWQRSAREQVTKPKFLNPNVRNYHPTTEHEKYDHVDAEFIDAFTLQNQVLNLLNDVLHSTASVIVGRRVEQVYYGKHNRHFYFRGMSLKFDGLYPDDKADFWWKILYEDYGLIQSFNKYQEPLKSYNLLSNNFFDMESQMRRQELEKFVVDSLSPKR